MSRLAIAAIATAALICCCALAGCAAVKPSVGARIVFVPSASATGAQPCTMTSPVCRSTQIVITPGQVSSFIPAARGPGPFWTAARGAGPFWTQKRAYGWTGGKIVPAPAPVPAQQAGVAGRCVAGYEPAYPASDGKSLGGYGPFTTGPYRDVTIGGVLYPPLAAYQLIFTNNGTAAVQTTTWLIIGFYTASGQNITNEQVTIQPSLVPASQSQSLTYYSSVDTSGSTVDLPAGGTATPSMPPGGFAACQLLAP